MKKIMLLVSGELFDALGNELAKTYMVHKCADSISAEKILQSKPDALILNMFLPGMDSLEFLKSHAGILPPVVIAMTFLLSNTLINELSALDVSYVIRLPYSLDVLLDRLAEQLAKNASPDNRRGYNWMPEGYSGVGTQ